MDRIKKIINNLLAQKVSLVAFSGTFLGVIILRIFEEQFIAKSVPISFYDVVIEIIHNLYFFLVSFLLLWLLLSWILKMNPKKLGGVFTWASLMILFPPLLDMIRTNGEVYWSFYIISSFSDLQLQFFTIFGHLPSGIVYFGTKIVFIFAIIFLTALVFIKTKDILKALITAIFSYIILFFMGCFPTLLGYLYYIFGEGKKLGDIQAFAIAQLFGSPNKIWGLTPPGFTYAFPFKLDIIYFPLLILLILIIFYRIDAKKLWAVMKNFRYPQLIYHAGLFFIGMGLGYLKNPDNLNFNVFSVFAVFTMVLSIWLAWKASVVANDIEDLEIDKMTNTKRPLPMEIFSTREYSHLGVACFLLSLLGAITIGLNFFVLLLVYQMIAWSYSNFPFRLKRFPLIATAVSATASMMVVFSGFILMSPGQTIGDIPWRIILLLFLAYTLGIPIKDFKDIAGDKKHEVWTIPVLLGEQKGRLVVAVNIFIVYMLSVFIINEMRLFFWALIFAVLTFLAMISPKIKPRKLPGVILGLVAVYGMILVYIVFL